MRVIPENARSNTHIDIILSPAEVFTLSTGRDLFAQAYTRHKDYFIRVTIQEENAEEKQVKEEG